MRGNALPNQRSKSHLVSTNRIWGIWGCGKLRTISIENLMRPILLKIWDIFVNLHSDLSPRVKLSDQEKLQILHTTLATYFRDSSCYMWLWNGFKILVKFL